MQDKNIEKDKMMTQNNEWIKFTGDECPVPKGTLVKVRYYTEEEIHIKLSNHVYWGYVTRYRIYEPPIVAELRKKLKIATDILQEISYSDAFVGDYCHLDDSVNKALEQIAELEGTK